MRCYHFRPLNIKCIMIHEMIACMSYSYVEHPQSIYGLGQLPIDEGYGLD
jgi:hypothetical protein